MNDHETPLMGKSKGAKVKRGGFLRGGNRAALKRQTRQSRFAKAVQYVSRNSIKVEKQM